jgi:hypothetical protein
MQINICIDVDELSPHLPKRKQIVRQLPETIKDTLPRFLFHSAPPQALVHSHPTLRLNTRLMIYRRKNGYVIGRVVRERRGEQKELNFSSAKRETTLRIV